jgi:helix-turn-helix protein
MSSTRLRSDPAPPAETELVISVDLDLLAQKVAALLSSRLDEYQAQPQSPWLDVPAAASHLACSPERLRKLVRRGIPYHQERPGGRLFFHRKEIDEWMLRQ